MHRVIIPKPIYHPLIAQPALPQPSLEYQTPTKSPFKSQLLSLKKPSGAFKVYKDRKIKNKDRQKTQAIEFFEKKQPISKKLYKLEVRSLAAYHKRQNEVTFDYYDPNTAPTFVEQSKKQFYFKLNQQKLLESNENKQAQNHQKTKVQKKITKQTEHNQSQYSFQMQLQQGSKDDTFIICKKVDIKQAKRQTINGQLFPDLKKSFGKKGELKSINLLKKERLKNEEKDEIPSKQSQIVKNQEIFEIKAISQQALKQKQKSDDFKEVTITQRGTDKKTLKELYMEQNCIGPSFILELQVESQSEMQSEKFDMLNRKKVLPMIK